MINYPNMRMDSHEYDTYGLVMPKATHTRPARCEEVTPVCLSMLADPGDETGLSATRCQESHCGPWAHGWKTLINLSTDLGQRQAKYIRDHSGRHYTVERESADGTHVALIFPAGQQCFTEHRVPLDRPPLLTLKRADFRTFCRPDVIDGHEWLDRFATNQDNLKTIKERG